MDNDVPGSKLLSLKGRCIKCWRMAVCAPASEQQAGLSGAPLLPTHGRRVTHRLRPCASAVRACPAARPALLSPPLAPG
jgi:hypothetical protein